MIVENIVFEVFVFFDVVFFWCESVVKSGCDLVLLYQLMSDVFVSLCFDLVVVCGSGFGVMVCVVQLVCLEVFVGNVVFIGLWVDMMLCLFGGCMLFVCVFDYYVFVFGMICVEFIDEFFGLRVDSVVMYCQFVLSVVQCGDGFVL